jgi:hypothetical protein
LRLVIRNMQNIFWLFARVNSRDDAAENNWWQLSPFTTVSPHFIATGEVTRSCLSFHSPVMPVTPRNEHLIKDRQTPCHIATLDPYQPDRRILHCLTRISEKIHYAYTISSRYKLWCSVGLIRSAQISGKSSLYREWSTRSIIFSQNNSSCYRPRLCV